MNKNPRTTEFYNKRVVVIIFLIVALTLLLVCTVSCEKPSPKLTRITAEYNGGDVEVGGIINKEDVAVTAHYSNNTQRLVTVFSLEYDFSEAGQREVTVKYGGETNGKTYKFNVNVVEPVSTAALSSITAIYNGDSIKIGGALNNDDIEVIAYYDDKTSNVVNNFAVGNFSSVDAGIHQVEVSYTEGDVTVTYFVNITVVDDKQQIVASKNLSVHFLELGNQSTGDCVFIKAGDTDILIDAGSTDGCATRIHNYISQYCTDGILEYVVATHAHEDHISAFVGTDNNPGIMSRYQCQTIIRYARANTTSQIRQKFETKCNAQVENGAKLYTALECVNNANGAQKLYDLTGDGNITMEVLNQRYYSENSSDENNYSVCVMINQKINAETTNHYLFTGDLEESGEKSLVDKNPNLPETVLFKGGHHGSYTATNEVLLQKIKPQYVCICCCAGNVEYLKLSPQNLAHSFPAQEMIDRIAKYTDRVYVTTLGFIRWDASKDKYFNDGSEPMNGNITFSCINGEISLYCSNNNLKLKDTDWFKNNRVCPDEWKNTQTEQTTQD